MKSKNKKYLQVISIIFVILIIFMSIGYAFFNESLTVSGVASTVDYYTGTMLPTNPIKLDTTNDRYETYSTERNKLNFRTEYWIGDTYIGIWNKEVGIAISRKTITYTISFSNPTELSYTNGTVEGTEISNNGLGYIKSASASISKTTLEPGEAVEVKLTITSNFLTRLNDQDIKATISYELQGEKRYFYFIIKYRGWDNE